MPTVDDVLRAFRAELVAADLVRLPGVAGAEPPAHIEPLEGAPAPGEREGVEDHPDITVTLQHGTDLAEPDGYAAAARRRTTIDVIYRARTASAFVAARAIDAAVRARLFRSATNYGYGFELGLPPVAIWVHEAGVWGGLGRLPSSKATGYRAVAKYLIETAP
jgi:hypothetical protein